MKSNCIICNIEFEKRTNAKTCSSKKCKQALKRLNSKKNYENKLLRKKCKYCNLVFIGKRNEKLCESCKGTRKVKQKKIQVILCPRCKEPCGFKEVITLHLNGGCIGRKLCKKCKSKSLKKISKRLKALGDEKSSRNKPKKEICEFCKKIFYHKKTSQVFCSKECFKLGSLKRMTTRNPMFNKHIVNKVVKTKRKNISNGITKIKSGPDHPLWKGNRDIASVCRQALYKEWVIKILERDNFKCTMCMCKENLQVHHVRPFRDIFKIVLKRINVDVSKKITDNDLIKKIIKSVCDEHKMSDGITVCCKCHSDIDDRYRRYKN